MILIFLFFIALIILLGLSVYALPATLTLPPGPRPGLAPLTIAQAARRLAATGMSGTTLVEAARALVADRMAYCRRNSFDPAGKAFTRGYGYCLQQAFALADLLSRLGVEQKVVHAYRNRFPDGTIGGHAWVQARIDGQYHDIDSIHFDTARGEIDFTPLTDIQEVTPAFKILAFWGSAGVNAHRYIRTGKDQ